MIGGEPFLAPLSSLAISQAVDVGCGTGVATLELSRRFPSAAVYGIDISSVPERVKNTAPPNVRWVVGNILELGQDGAPSDLATREVLQPGQLDYVFGRMLFLGISDWPRYFSVTSSAMRSGAVIEHHDLDWSFYRVGTSECLSDSWEWHKEVLIAAQQSGLSTTAGSGAAVEMEKCGLEVITKRVFEFSFVPSRKTPNSQAMGLYVQAKLVPHYPELLRKMLLPMGIDGERLEKLIEDCLRDIGSEEGIHQKYIVTIARKV